MVRSFKRLRSLVACGGTVSLAAAGVLTFAAPANAAQIVSECTTSIGINSTQTFDFTIVAPAESEIGLPITVTIPGGTRVFEAGIDTDNNPLTPALTVHYYFNIFSKYGVTGGSIIPGSVSAAGAPTFNGNPVTPDTPAVTANSIQTGLQGPLVPTGTLASPDVSFQIQPDAVGVPVSVIGVQAGSGVAIGDPAAPLEVQATCPLADTVLSTTNVVAPPPPPPGAPDAVVDNVTTNKNTALVIDVLANDTPDVGGLAIDKDSLEITTDPTKGEAVVNDDYTITYTPDADATGVDSFRYTLCSVADPQTETPGACDSAAVNVTIVDPDAVPATTTTTAPPAAAAVTTTTAAPAQLPRTGGSTVPLATMGATILLAGFALVLRQKNADTPGD